MSLQHAPYVAPVHMHSHLYATHNITVIHFATANEPHIADYVRVHQKNSKQQIVISLTTYMFYYTVCIMPVYTQSI